MEKTNTAVKSEQIVVFRLGEESYGVDIGAVREIVRVPEIVHVPNAPEFVEGLINLRGKVIPVVDLATKFALSTKREGIDSRIVVTDIGGEDVGVLVDAVTEVMRIDEDLIEPASPVVTGAGSQYVKGIANVGETLIILLDVQRMLSRGEQDVLSQAQPGAAATKRV